MSHGDSLIPFNKPVSLGTEAAAVTEVLLNGYAAGDGPFGKRCEQRLEGLLGQRTILVTSATHALEMAALLLEVGPGDEVIMPSYTFVSTANAFVLRGATPVFADVDLNGNISIAEVEQLITPRTKAVVPVHYAGNSCDLDALATAIGRIPMVEDAAQAITSTFRGRPLGTFGSCAAFSFHETKNIGCGEGGALTIRDPNLRDRAEYLREKGTNRKKFHEGLVDKYTWVDVGSSYVLSDLNAAYLYTQLERINRVQERRKEVFERYLKELSAAVDRAGGYVVQPHRDNQPNYHLFGIVFRLPDQRTRFIAHMKAHGILAPFHYVALHQSPMGRRFPPRRPVLNSERLTSCLVRLPLFFNIQDAEVDEVIGRAQEFLRAL